MLIRKRPDYRAFFTHDAARPARNFQRVNAARHDTRPGAVVERNCRQFESILTDRCAAKKSAQKKQGAFVAHRTDPATILVAIAVMLDMTAIANAIQELHAEIGPGPGSISWAAFSDLVRRGGGPHAANLASDTEYYERPEGGRIQRGSLPAGIGGLFGGRAARTPDRLHRLVRVGADRGRARRDDRRTAQHGDREAGRPGNAGA